jgi:hypothetical protein
VKSKLKGGWTVETLKEHLDKIEILKDQVAEERDRRYKEVEVEKAKAMKIKETADFEALSLARESQTYKEQQNDALRDKNLAQSGIYATTADVAHAFDELKVQLKPVFDFVIGWQGQATKGESIWGRGTTMIALAVGAAGFIYSLIPK